MVRLAVLQGDRDNTYLGLPSGTRVFGLTEVTAELLVVDVYDEMCTTCLKSLDTLHELAKRVDGDPVLRGQVKVVALAMGGTKRAVARFRRKNTFSFPLFADEKRRVFTGLRKPVLPAVYFLRRSSGSPPLLVAEAQWGELHPAQRYLDIVQGILSQEQ